MNPQEQMAQAIKILRKQAQDNLVLADWLESMKVVETPATPVPTPPAQEEAPKE